MIDENTRPKYIPATCEKNTIKIFQMKHPNEVTQFKRYINDIKWRGYKDIIIDLSEIHSIYPCSCVPITGIIQNLKAEGYTIKLIYDNNSYINKLHFEVPYLVSEHKSSLSYPFDKLWRFSGFEEVSDLVQAYIEELSCNVKCSSGLIESLIWSLNETMDNVLQHALCNDGYVMGSIIPIHQLLFFTIYDNGQGIFNSLKDSQYHPRNAIDAITLAIQEGKTRDTSIGQGNGLWGLTNIVLENKGRLNITSHDSALRFNESGHLEKFNNLPYNSKRNGTTTVDFTLRYDNDVSLIKALNGYIPLDIKFENMENEEGDIIFRLCDETNGYGTRIAGGRLRNKIVNYFERIGFNSLIAIDFENVTIISSSFADEFIGKLLLDLGFSKFSQRIKLMNMNSTVEAIINRSVGQRMATVFNSNTVTSVIVDDFE